MSRINNDETKMRTTLNVTTGSSSDTITPPPDVNRSNTTVTYDVVEVTAPTNYKAVIILQGYNFNNDATEHLPGGRGTAAHTPGSGSARPGSNGRIHDVTGTDDVYLIPGRSYTFLLWSDTSGYVNHTLNNGSSNQQGHTYIYPPPTISISSDESSLKAGETSTITFTLSETSTDFALEDVTVSGGSLSNFSGSGTSYTSTFTPTVNSTTDGVISVVSGKFSDTAGNLNIASNTLTITIDIIRPTIAISSDKSSLEFWRTTDETAAITFTLSETSTDFDVNDITVSGGTLSDFSGSGTSYTSTFNPDNDSIDDGVISVVSGKFSDAVGNLNIASNTLTISVDTTNDVLMKTVVISMTIPDVTNAGIANPLNNISFEFYEQGSSTEIQLNNNFAGYTQTNTFVATAQAGTFEKTYYIQTQAHDRIDVKAIGTNDAIKYTSLTITYGGISTTYTTINDSYFLSNTYKYPVNSDNTVGWLSSPLNESGPAQRNYMDLANTRPTIAISSNKSILKAQETETITFDLTTRPYFDFALEDVDVSGGTLDGFSGSGTSYTATFTPNEDSTDDGVISVASGKFYDTAGNLNIASNTLTISIDTISPTITIGLDKSSLEFGETAAITFTLSEASTDFVEGDIDVSGGALSNFSGSGTYYQATFTPDNDSTDDGVISVAENVFSDVAGNSNTLGDSLTITIDTVPTKTFNYTGQEEIFTVHSSVNYVNIEAYGGRGGNRSGHGYGAIVSDTYDLTKFPNFQNRKLYINVAGSSGTSNSGGYNGGGIGSDGDLEDRSIQVDGCGGGGASHVSLESGLLNTFDGWKKAVLIAAGGGGGHRDEVLALVGKGHGGQVGTRGARAGDDAWGGGGTQSQGGESASSHYQSRPEKGSGGLFGKGGGGTDAWAWFGGGGGWYGGAGGFRGDGGGGGSSYSNSTPGTSLTHSTTVSYTTGQSTAGKVIFSWGDKYKYKLGNTYTIDENFTLTQDFTLKSTEILIINSGVTLTLNATLDVTVGTLTNNGTIDHLDISSNLVGTTGGYYNNIICFYGFVNIMTEQGLKQIKDLKQGDMILTNDGYQPLAELDVGFNPSDDLLMSKLKSTDFMVKIPKDFLTENVPSEDVYVTKTHPLSVKITSADDDKDFEFLHLFVKELMQLGNGIEYVRKDRETKLYNLIFDNHYEISVGNMKFLSHHPNHLNKNKYLVEGTEQNQQNRTKKIYAIEGQCFFDKITLKDLLKQKPENMTDKEYLASVLSFD